MTAVVGSVLETSTPVGGLRPGMVVFCNRPSFMQRCNDLAGDSFRHAGVMIDTDDGLMMCGFAPKRNYCLIPAEKLATYSRVGVADVLSDEQVQVLHRWVGQFDGRPTSYPQFSVFMAGILSYARTMSRGVARRLLVAWCLWYCARLSRRYRDRVAFICSTFVLAALNASLDEPLLMAMTDDKFEATEYLATTTTRDLLLARWLATPSDLWRSIPLRMRSELTFDPHTPEAATTPPAHQGSVAAVRHPDGFGAGDGPGVATPPEEWFDGNPLVALAPYRADPRHPVLATASNFARAGPDPVRSPVAVRGGGLVPLDSRDPGCPKRAVLSHDLAGC